MGMSALAINLIRKRIILTTAISRCETWGQLPYREIEMLERAQRYFVQFIQMMDNRSLTDSCISNVGLWSERLINKIKILYFRMLCRAKYINGF